MLIYKYLLTLSVPGVNFFTVGKKKGIAHPLLSFEPGGPILYAFLFELCRHMTKKAILIGPQVLKPQTIMPGTGNAKLFVLVGTYLVLGIGSLMTIIGFLGCCGAWRESSWMLGTVRTIIFLKKNIFKLNSFTGF